MKLNSRDLDNIHYANQWGNTETWQGRMMYVSPETASEMTRDEWLNFVLAIGAIRAEILNNPKDYDHDDADMIWDLAKWAHSKTL